MSQCGAESNGFMLKESNKEEGSGLPRDEKGTESEMGGILSTLYFLCTFALG